MWQLIYAIFTMVVGVLGCAAYFFGSNKILDLIFPSQPDLARDTASLRSGSNVLAWIFLILGLVALLLYFIKPPFFDDGIMYSPTSFVGFFEFLADLSSVIVVVTMLLVLVKFKAWLFDAKRSVFLIFFALSIAAAVVYANTASFYVAQVSNKAASGEFVTNWLGGSKQGWFGHPFWNNFLLLTIAVWLLAGIGMLLLASALSTLKFGVADATTQEAARNMRRASMIRPWLFLGPAMIALTLYLIYPVFDSIRLSFMDRGGQHFVGFFNYIWMFGDAQFRESIVNNFLWLLVVPAAATFMGLVIAVLTDRIWWGNIAKSLIFMPMAISFVGAAVIWKFVYDYRDVGAAQIGILNAIVVFFGGEPHAWITIPFWNNFFLMAILVWIQSGFAMVILSAALRGIPEETIEAAVIDGANGFQIFFKIMVPQIWGTIAVVWTTITILVLKVFDIVLAMTNGQWNSQVLANLMFDWMFRGGGDFGRGAAIAIVIMVLVIPIMVWNIRNARKEMEGR